MSSGEGGSVDPGWRSGRSPATRDRLRERNVPHIAPLCNTDIDFHPTSLESGHYPNLKVARLQGIRRWGGFVRNAPTSAPRVADEPSARGLAAFRASN